MRRTKRMHSSHKQLQHRSSSSSVPAEWEDLACSSLGNQAHTFTGRFKALLDICIWLPLGWLLLFPVEGAVVSRRRSNNFEKVTRCARAFFRREDGHAYDELKEH